MNSPLLHFLDLMLESLSHFTPDVVDKYLRVAKIFSNKIFEIKLY